MGKISTNISIDPKLKAEAIELFSSFGLDLSTAISLFLSQSVREKRIPFEIRLYEPNEETKKALKELDLMKKDKEKYKRYDNFEEILEEMKK